ncbi:uncharacterized protein METZ01_LOCUS15351 [marine metagenome]|uniref:Uncharacterized protein n=1 Tax=marine metagenome TaxID=408172 RepID=A0A381P803_9ZZZZ
MLSGYGIHKNEYSWIVAVDHNRQNPAVIDISEIGPW